ncbi:isoprenyl transferase [Flavobacteriaceae bacterium]|jgi:undecaprenyl diphosphate synthase|nr:isoprenyl transferase [Flavobacteriaceae bacterium]MDA7711727.1 isoprenyl transferase [Flavobacteriaceae bacterium]
MKILPKHLAIIMDGNGRWAKQRGKQRIFGHSNGVKSVREVVEECARLGIEYLTLFAFSTENWSRPEDEVNVLMKLLVTSLKKEFKKLAENNIVLKTIGNTAALPEVVQKELAFVIEKTKNNSGMNLTLALNYGAREEITQAFRSLAVKVKNSIISPEKVDQSVINEHLYTRNMPEVDLLIRSSGEKRISNFLLWQIAYAELYFTKVLWPDFRKEELHNALLNYENRERRFGKTSEQLNA